MTLNHARVFVLIASLFLLKAASAFSVVFHSVTVDGDSQEIGFVLRFDQVPDFSTVDEFNRQANEFQYYFDVDAEIVPAGGNTQQGLSERIFRGGEIHVDGDLRIRNTQGDDPDPTSGGWGLIAGTVDFVLVGAELSFVVPWAMLGEDDGIFSYSLLTGEFGSGTQVIYGNQSTSTNVVPVPAAFWLFCSGIFALLVRSRR